MDPQSRSPGYVQKTTGASTPCDRCAMGRQIGKPKMGPHLGKDQLIDLAQKHGTEAQWVLDEIEKVNK